MMSTASQNQSNDRSLVRGDGWRLRLANAADAPAMSDLLRATTFGGSTPLSEARGSTPFRLREAEAVNAETWPMHFLIENEAGDAMGYLSSVTEQRLRRGAKTSVCHIADIRLHPSLRHGKVLPQALAFVLDISRERAGAEVGFTVFLNSDHRSMLAFLKRENHRFEQPMAQVIQQLDLFLLPPKHRLSTSKRYRLERLTEPVLEETAAFISKRQTGKMFGRPLSAEGLLAELKTWPAAEKEAFFLARGDRGRLVGCALGWRTEDLRAFLAHSTSWRSGGKANRRPQGWRKVPKGRPLAGLLQITHLEVADDQPAALQTLLSGIRAELDPGRTAWTSYCLSRQNKLQSSARQRNPIVLTGHVTALTPAGSRWNNVDLRADDVGVEHAFW